MSNSLYHGPLQRQEDLVVNAIYSTTNYDQFRLDPSNRPIDMDHAAEIADSIARKNMLEDNPIKVDTNRVIIDGQHRWYAAKQLGLRIYYQITKSANRDDVALLNSYQRNWRVEDYLHRYCTEGNAEYLRLREFQKKYPFLTTATAYQICHYGDKVDLHKYFKDGTYKANNIVFATKVVEAAKDFAIYFDGAYERVFISALYNLFSGGQYDHARMMRKMKFLSTRLVKCVDVDSYIDLFNKLYNYKESDSDRVILSKYTPNRKRDTEREQENGIQVLRKAA